MNKILVNSEKIQKLDLSKNKIRISQNGSFVFEVNHIPKELEIIISEGISTKITLSGECLFSKIKLVLEANSSLMISSFLINSNVEMKSYLIGKNADLFLSMGSLCTQDCDYHFSIYHQSPQTTSKIYIHGLSVSQADILFDVNGFVEKKSSNCSCFQDSKIIHLEDSKSRIDPNLFIENYDIEASHAAFIGSFQENELFYLMSRGLSRKKSYSLLIHSFLFGNMALTQELREKWIQRVESKIQK